jgi:hypothetical protein
MNYIYIPKFKVKTYSSYMYNGETSENYSNYNQFQTKNELFDDKTRSRDDLILGIESSFDDSSCSLINSYGEIKSNVIIS